MKLTKLSGEKRALLEQRLRKNTISGHTLVAQSLKKLGITHVYGISGTPIVETLATCAKIGIRPIGVHHQQAAVMMAMAHNYVSGRLTAIAIVSAGPAVTNAVTGILVAKDNCWPVVVIGGRRPLKTQGMGTFQDLDAIPIFQPITKWSALVDSTDKIPEYLARACHTAISGRPGPVYLDLPEEVLTGTTHKTSNVVVNNEYVSPAIDPNAIEQAVEILRQAKRPAIILGKGVRWSNAYEEIQHLINFLRIPYVTSPMGRGYLPDDHPLCYNAARSLLQSRADAILIVGARIDWTFRYGTEFSLDTKIIQIDIHEQEIGVNVTPTVGIVGDAKQVLKQLLIWINKENVATQLASMNAWHSLLDARRDEQRQKLDSQINNRSLPMSPYRMVKEIRDFLPRDAISVLDGNIIMAVAQEVLPCYLPVSRFTVGSNGCIGVGIPFAIGAKLSHPDRPVIVICGDAAFGFSAMEMETAVRHRIPIIVVVANNEGISGAHTQKAFYPLDYERVTMFQPGIRYEKIMSAFGGHAEFVEYPEQLIPALKRGLASGLPACINVRVDPFTPYPQQ
jgi:thiamine pyrophosphate-dependent acetolactate synthase large subunit-like protein